MGGSRQAVFARTWFTCANARNADPPTRRLPAVPTLCTAPWDRASGRPGCSAVTPVTQSWRYLCAVCVALPTVRGALCLVLGSDGHERAARPMATPARKPHRSESACQSHGLARAAQHASTGTSADALENHALPMGGLSN